jgi:hypothetical protein
MFSFAAPVCWDGYRNKSRLGSQCRWLIAYFGQAERKGIILILLNIPL